MHRKSVYLASPLGFAASTRGFMAELASALAAHVEVVNPWDTATFNAEIASLSTENDWSRRVTRLHQIDMELARLNTESIDAADAVFAILDGIDVDSGTAAEIGYGFARGKFVTGLRTDFRLAGDNDGSIVNLQVEYFIEASGGRIVRTVEDLVAVASEFAAR